LKSARLQEPTGRNQFRTRFFSRPSTWRAIPARWAERALRSWHTASGLPDRSYAKLQAWTVSLHRDPMTSILVQQQSLHQSWELFSPHALSVVHAKIPGRNFSSNTPAFIPLKLPGNSNSEGPPGKGKKRITIRSQSLFVTSTRGFGSAVGCLPLGSPALLSRLPQGISSQGTSDL
ncbi:PREDICTED: LOW QUALITY PROTEIN: protein FAM218A, partial [Rhinopithecus bieti]|uniref:LOW QUALITY PROTEIN: protein FAM218A n=1 Tax=Rhinopithecus bieti TaxID=61621 RepID=UPI00083BE763